METSSYSVTIGSVTYVDFPTYSELNKVRPDVVKNMIFFFRLLGLCSLRQVNEAFGERADETRAKWMFDRAGVSCEEDEKMSASNVRDLQTFQVALLGADDSAYTVKVTDIVNLLHRSEYVNNSQKALKALLRTQQLEKANVAAEQVAPEPAKDEPKDESKDEPKNEPAAVSKTANEEVERQINAIVKSCMISPVYSFSEAKKTDGYLARLIEKFPHVPTEAISAYLFFGKINKFSINAALKEAGVSRGRGFRVKDDSLIERTAFVAWTGGNWRKYYESGGEIEIVPPNDEKKRGPKPKNPEPKAQKTPKSPKDALPPLIKIPDPPKRDHETQPATTQERIAAVPKINLEKPKAAEQSKAQATAIITVTGPYQKIKDLIFSLETDSALKLTEYTVKK